MSEWQPIETAPSQQTILLWAITDTSMSPPNWKMATGHWATVLEQWIWDGREVRDHEVQPTHWMPLPEPPNA